jgi:outer membrane murein-binding lipoprotein Lpp
MDLERVITETEFRTLSQQVQQLQAQVATLTAERDAWRDRAGQVALQAAVARLEAILTPGARDTSPREGATS